MSGRLLAAPGLSSARRSFSPSRHKVTPNGGSPADRAPPHRQLWPLHLSLVKRLRLFSCLPMCETTRRKSRAPRAPATRRAPFDRRQSHARSPSGSQSPRRERLLFSDRGGPASASTARRGERPPWHSPSRRPRSCLSYRRRLVEAALFRYLPSKNIFVIVSAGRANDRRWPCLPWTLVGRRRRPLAPASACWKRGALRSAPRCLPQPRGETP